VWAQSGQQRTPQKLASPQTAGAGLGQSAHRRSKTRKTWSIKSAQGSAIRWPTQPGARTTRWPNRRRETMRQFGKKVSGRRGMKEGHAHYRCPGPQEREEQRPYAGPLAGKGKLDGRNVGRRANFGRNGLITRRGKCKATRTEAVFRGFTSSPGLLRHNKETRESNRI